MREWVRSGLFLGVILSIGVGLLPHRVSDFFDQEPYSLGQVPADQEACLFCKLPPEQLVEVYLRHLNGQLLFMLRIIIDIWFDSDCGESLRFFAKKRESCYYGKLDPEHIHLLYLLNLCNCWFLDMPKSFNAELKEYIFMALFDFSLLFSELGMCECFEEHKAFTKRVYLFHSLKLDHNRDTLQFIDNHDICRLLSFNYRYLKKLFTFCRVIYASDRICDMLNFIERYENIDENRLVVAFNYLYTIASHRPWGEEPSKCLFVCEHYFTDAYHKICFAEVMPEEKKRVHGPAINKFHRTTSCMSVIH